MVRLYPTTGAYIPGEPAIERDVTSEEAERLLAYSPPAYTTEPPVVAPDPSEDLPEDIEQPVVLVEQTGDPIEE